jgi:hypothetical protein
MQIYISKSGQQHGPYSLMDIKKFILDGTVTPDDLAWYEGAAEWIPLRAVPGISLPTSPAQQSNVSDNLAYAMLAITAIAGLLIWQSGSLGIPAITISFSTIIATAILAYVEAKQLGMGTDGDRTPKGKKQSGPGSWALVILLLWIIGFPSYLYTRSRYGARNLLLPAIAVALVFLAAPFLAAPMLPAVDSPEVVQLAQRAITESPAFKLAGLAITIANPGEISYDRASQKRVARAELRTNLGTEVIYYTVEWQNRNKGIIWVQIQAHP